jgi:protein-S-isoprenylcysteine O-methyltransferase Ste14
MLVRQLLSFLALPFTAAVLVPWWITRSAEIQLAASADVGAVVIAIAGAGFAIAGIGLFGWSLYHFWTEGRGTLAPWDPPRRFVVTGPYRYVRNPMISGVMFVLVAEACLFRARPLVEWAALFALINAVYIPLLEEPDLQARFGRPYKIYRRHVRRFVPRFTPYTPA